MNASPAAPSATLARRAHPRHGARTAVPLSDQRQTGNASVARIRFGSACGQCRRGWKRSHGQAEPRAQPAAPACRDCRFRSPGSTARAREVAPRRLPHRWPRARRRAEDRQDRAHPAGSQTSGSSPAGAKARRDQRPDMRARRPAASPSKHSVGSSDNLQSSSNCSVVSEVPSGATVAS